MKNTATVTRCLMTCHFTTAQKLKKVNQGRCPFKLIPLQQLKIKPICKTTNDTKFAICLFTTTAFPGHRFSVVDILVLH